MGMFDYAKIEYPLPDGWAGTDLQTKDFDCILEYVDISEDGRLTVYGEDSDYTGKAEFIGFEGTHPDGRYIWHRYSFTFKDGRVVNAEVLPV